MRHGQFLRRRSRATLGGRVRPSVTVLESRLAPATLVVTNVLDTPRAPDPGSLRAILAAAHDGDVITFAPELAGQTIQEGAQVGPEGFVIDKNVRIVGPGADKLTIRGVNGGQSGPNQRVFDVRSGVFTTIAGLTIAGGSGYGVTNGGGGVRNLGTLVARGVVFSGNSATFGLGSLGGAVYNSGSAFFDSCDFSYNFASAQLGRAVQTAPQLAAGGAIYSAGGRIDLVGCNFRQNSALAGSFGKADALGGAVYATNTDVTVRDSYFFGNLARADSAHLGNFLPASATGGALAVQGGTLTVAASTFAFNSTAAQENAIGGAIAIDGGAALVARNVTVSNNTVTGSPVGLAVSSTAFVGGAGIAVLQGTVSLDSVTVADNAARMADPTGFFAQNVITAVRGGGLYNAAATNAVAAKNSILALNTVTGPNSSGPNVAGTIQSRGYLLIDATEGATILGKTHGNIFGRDPRLAPLADNGGPTPTRALLPDSPAVNAGSTKLRTDQRGVRRHGRTDIGAFELRPSRPSNDHDDDCWRPATAAPMTIRQFAALFAAGSPVLTVQQFADLLDRLDESGES
ncbi:MAG: choice-of-anchor Q domain-containing protein [Gemmataceae bacterium]